MLSTEKGNLWVRISEWLHQRFYCGCFSQTLFYYYCIVSKMFCFAFFSKLKMLQDNIVGNLLFLMMT